MMQVGMQVLRSPPIDSCVYDVAGDRRQHATDGKFQVIRIGKCVGSEEGLLDLVIHGRRNEFVDGFGATKHLWDEGGCRFHSGQEGKI